MSKLLAMLTCASDGLALTPSIHRSLVRPSTSWPLGPNTTRVDRGQSQTERDQSWLVRCWTDCSVWLCVGVPGLLTLQEHGTGQTVVHASPTFHPYISPSPSLPPSLPPSFPPSLSLSLPPTLSEKISGVVKQETGWWKNTWAAEK